MGFIEEKFKNPYGEDAVHLYHEEGYVSPCSCKPSLSDVNT